MTVQRGFQTSFGGFRGQLELWVADSSGLVLEKTNQVQVLGAWTITF